MFNFIQPSSAVILALATLFFQTFFSTWIYALYGADGGAWPIILLVFLTADIIYARLMLYFLITQKLPSKEIVWSTIILSALLLIYNNAYLLFGTQWILLISTSKITKEIMQSSSTPYLLYFSFAVIPLLIRLWKERASPPS